jgi:hypothetical protein
VILEGSTWRIPVPNRQIVGVPLFLRWNTFLRGALVTVARASAEWRDHDGIRMGVVVARSMDEETCYGRIRFAVQIIEHCVPYRWKRMRRDVREILCFGTGRDAALGAYVPRSRTCLIDPRHVLDPAVSPLDLAQTILHEATHARLHRHVKCERLRHNERVEAICRRAERDLNDKFTNCAI